MNNFIYQWQKSGPDQNGEKELRLIVMCVMKSLSPKNL